TVLTVLSCLVATAWAALVVSDGVVDRAPIGRVIATELAIIWPALFVTMTKSPPTTGSLLYVRRYGTYWAPAEGVTLPWMNDSAALLCRYDGRVATSAAAFCEAVAAGLTGVVGGTGAAAAADDVAVLVATIATSATPMTSRRLDGVMTLP